MAAALYANCNSKLLVLTLANAISPNASFTVLYWPVAAIAPDSSNAFIAASTSFWLPLCNAWTNALAFSPVPVLPSPPAVLFFTSSGVANNESPPDIT